MPQQADVSIQNALNGYHITHTELILGHQYLSAFPPEYPALIASL